MNRSADIFTFLMACMVCVVFFTPQAYSQETSQTKADNRSSVSTLIEQMVGTWDVEARMWPSARTEPTNLPPSVAKRRLIGDSILEEVMTPAPSSKQESFTRIAYFNYNLMNQQYEYFSIDTRLPQMMVEKSYASNVKASFTDHGKIILFGDDFVAPQWGKNKNVSFRYQLVIGEVENNRQVVRLYLTPQTGKNNEEFLAFEYVYTRRR